ncbi:MAG: hypothetical protein H7841_12675 [Magnetospirillum sp. WYHS-4]
MTDDIRTTSARQPQGDSPRNRASDGAFPTRLPGPARRVSVEMLYFFDPPAKAR